MPVYMGTGDWLAESEHKGLAISQNKAMCIQLFNDIHLRLAQLIALTIFRKYP